MQWVPALRVFCDLKKSKCEYYSPTYAEIGVSGIPGGKNHKGGGAHRD